MGRLLLLFVVVPAVELALLIEIGSRIGTAATLGIIVATGIVGAALARRQGLAVLGRLQAETAAGRLPADPMIDGAFLLVAGALLVTPGVLTDVVGFSCLVPGFRSLVKRSVKKRLERAVAEGRVEMHVSGMHGSAMGGAPWPGGREERVVEGRVVDRQPSPPSSPMSSKAGDPDRGGPREPGSGGGP